MSRILFVDDQPEILSSMRNMLRRFRGEWDMHFAEGGEAALQVLDQQPFDVVVCDMRMPGMNGAALLEAVQERHPQIARIMLSGYSDAESALRAVPVSHQFVSKPCRPKELQQTVNRVLNAQAQLNNPMVGKLVGELKRLPSPPALYHRLCLLIAQDQVHQKNVAELIESDPAMTARVLQLVNSAYFRAAREIRDVKEAIVYLGLEVLSRLVLAAEVFGAETGDSNGVDVAAVQKHSLAVARLASQIAPEPIRESAYVAALLHDVGMLVWSRMGDVDACGLDVDWLDRDQEQLHALLGAYLLGMWGLPYSCVEVARHHHNPEAVEVGEFDELGAVFVAHQLVTASERGEAPDVDRLNQYLAPFDMTEALGGWMRATEEDVLGAAA